LEAIVETIFGSSVWRKRKLEHFWAPTIVRRKNLQNFWLRQSLEANLGTILGLNFCRRAKNLLFAGQIGVFVLLPDTKRASGPKNVSQQVFFKHFPVKTDAFFQQEQTEGTESSFFLHSVFSVSSC